MVASARRALAMLLVSGVLVVGVPPRTVGLGAGALIMGAAAVSGVLMRGAKAPRAVPQ